MIFKLDPTLSDFGFDPWWLVTAKVLAVFVVLVLLVLFSI
jgi:NADH-quinone oxidoreductase subunit H